MITKLTDKQEKYCKAFVEIGNKSEAYRMAYDCSKMKPTSINRKAVEVHENVNVSARIKKLQEEQQKRHNVTVESLLIELEEARQMAIETKKAGAMSQATMGKARICGLDRQIIEHQNAQINLTINRPNGD